MDKLIKLGIIGIGNMGSAHARKIYQGMCPDFQLVAVADTDPDREAWCAENLGEDIIFFRTAEEMLDSGKPKPIGTL